MDTAIPINLPKGKHIVFFDGICNLCNNAIDFILARDRDEKFIFESLQSESASILLKEKSSELEYMLVLTEKGELLDRSEAALFIAKRISGWPKILGVLKILPKTFRDFFYMLVANNRYRIFGKKSTCRIPESSIKSRFLESYQNN